MYDHKFKLWTFTQEKKKRQETVSENTNQDDCACLCESLNCDVVARSYFGDFSPKVPYIQGPIVVQHTTQISNHALS